MGAEPNVDRAQLDAAVVAEQIRLLIHGRADLPINLINAGIVTAILRPYYPIWLLVSWLVLFCSVIFARTLIRRHYRIAAPGIEKARRWGRIFTLNAFATACLWGLTASIILVTPDPVFHVFIVFVLGGMMAGGIVSNASYFPATIAFMVPTISPAIVILLTRDDATQIAMGWMLAVFAAVLVIAGRNINQSIVENFRLRIAQDLLLIKLQASEAGMATAQEIAHVGSWDFDLQTKRGAWSTETFRIFGDDPATCKPSFETMLARVHPGDLPAAHQAYAKATATGAPHESDHRLVMDDGTIKYVHESGRTTFDAEGRALRINGIVQDITERKNAEDRLQFANSLLTTEMEASPDGILVIDPARKITSFNRRFADIWKIPPADLRGGNLAVALAKATPMLKDPQTFIARVHYLFDHPGENSQEEYELTDGRIINRYVDTLTSPAGDYLGRVWFFRDVTESKRAEAKALRMARFDVLTGLANRSVFVEELEHAVARAKRGEKGFAVIYLDLDHFKDVNDTQGHPTGDALLQAVAQRLRANTRAADTVARFGGDEFAVVVADIAEPSDAAILAEKLIAALADPFSIAGNDIYSGASIGIDIYGPEADDAETLLSHADVALYRAKSEGRNDYRFFTDAMDLEVRMRVALGTELHEAVAAGQLFLLYQPQVAIDSGKITGVEALVRWRHPGRGILEPELFVPVAEKIGIITKLGHWVLATACRQAKAWLDEGFAPIRIGVNVSALQFKAPVALETDIAAILAKAGLPPQMLELELTETVLMDASREHSDVLAHLRDAGVTIAIDDFGTGYSSLDYLRRFPANRIKISQNFVEHLQSVAGDAIIVKATIGLGRELGIAVIAEGVETRTQFELLRDWGCAEIQGFYFAPPLAAEAVTLLLRQGGTIEPRAIV